jgi:hypothetical protein
MILSYIELMIMVLFSAVEDNIFMDADGPEWIILQNNSGLL